MGRGECSAPRPFRESSKEREQLMQGMAVDKIMRVEKVRILAFFVLALLVAVLMGVVLGAKTAYAVTTFTVNSTGDENDLDFPDGTNDGFSDGTCDVDSETGGNQCTLRAAIQQANRKDNLFGGPDLI